MGTMARCCAYGPYGDFIAVGFGGRVGRMRAGKRAKSDGMVRLYSRTTLEKLCEVNDAREWLSDIKFSPCDTTNTLVVSSHDNTIYHYDVVVNPEAANGAVTGTTSPHHQTTIRTRSHSC